MCIRDRSTLKTKVFVCGAVVGPVPTVLLADEISKVGTAAIATEFTINPKPRLAENAIIRFIDLVPHIFHPKF